LSLQTLQPNCHNEPTLRCKEHSSQADLELRHSECQPSPSFLSTTQLTSPFQVDERASSIDVKLASINAELTTYQTKLSKMRDGPGKTAIKQKALKVLQRRKMYESQRDQLQQQSWNMEQAGMMQDNLKNVMTTVDAMKTTNKALKQQYGKIDIDKIERMQDEMADLMDIGNDINESISRSYDVPEDVDEAELDAELEALGEETELEGMMSEGTPSFMVDEVPQFIDEPPVKEGAVKEAAG
jgi:charged multivesicular body protein 5